MSAPFRAFVVNQTADGFQMGIQWLEQRDLLPRGRADPGGVCGGKLQRCTRLHPQWQRGTGLSAGAGLELTGVVVELTDPRFQFARHLQKALHTASHMKW